MAKKMSVAAIRQTCRLLENQLRQKFQNRQNELYKIHSNNQIHTNEAINKYLAAAAAKYGIENLVVLSLPKNTTDLHGVRVNYTKKVQKDIDRIRKSCNDAYNKRRETYDRDYKELEDKYRKGRNLIDGLALSLLVTEDVSGAIANIKNFIEGM